MGLDMYLKGEKYLSQYDEADKALAGKVQALIKDAPGEITNVTAEVGYWRKANQIHGWFVNNVQDGVDECQNAYVSRENLAELLGVCKEVAADHSRAEELLPNTCGFFFGGQDYDEWYFKDIEQTVAIIEPLLDAKFKDWSFSYRSSW